MTTIAATSHQWTTFIALALFLLTLTLVAFRATVPKRPSRSFPPRRRMRPASMGEILDSVDWNDLPVKDGSRHWAYRRYS